MQEKVEAKNALSEAGPEPMATHELEPASTEHAAPGTKVVAVESEGDSTGTPGGVQASTEGDSSLLNTTFFATSRLVFCPPSIERDQSVHTLFNDAATMFPHLAMLHNLPQSVFKARRDRHRTELAHGGSLFLDILLQSTGELVGTTGFREIDVAKGVAEWGVIVAKQHQRQQICADSFATNVVYLADTLPSVTAVMASTLPDNLPMLDFFDKVGLVNMGAHVWDDDDGVEWIVFSRPVSELILTARPRAAAAGYRLPEDDKDPRARSNTAMSLAVARDVTPCGRATVYADNDARAAPDAARDVGDAVPVPEPQETLASLNAQEAPGAHTSSDSCLPAANSSNTVPAYMPEGNTVEPELCQVAVGCILVSESNVDDGVIVTGGDEDEDEDGAALTSGIVASDAQQQSSRLTARESLESAFPLEQESGDQDNINLNPSRGPIKVLPPSFFIFSPSSFFLLLSLFLSPPSSLPLSLFLSTSFSCITAFPPRGLLMVVRTGVLRACPKT